MSLWVCRSCTAKYAVGLTACPQCGSSNHAEDSMPKITRSSSEPVPQPVPVPMPEREPDDAPGGLPADGGPAVVAPKPAPVHGTVSAP